MVNTRRFTDRGRGHLDQRRFARQPIHHVHRGTAPEQRFGSATVAAVRSTVECGVPVVIGSIYFSVAA
jgi:hypothetical protein